MMYEIKRCVLHKDGTIFIDLWNEVKQTNIEVTLSFRRKLFDNAKQCYDFICNCSAATPNMIAEIYEYFMKLGE